MTKSAEKVLDKLEEIISERIAELKSWIKLAKINLDRNRELEILPILGENQALWAQIKELRQQESEKDVDVADIEFPRYVAGLVLDYCETQNITEPYIKECIRECRECISALGTSNAKLALLKAQEAGRKFLIKYTEESIRNNGISSAAEVGYAAYYITLGAFGIFANKDGTLRQPYLELVVTFASDINEEIKNKIDVWEENHQ